MTVSRWERGVRAPKGPELGRLAAALGVTVDQLLGTSEALRETPEFVVPFLPVSAALGLAQGVRNPHDDAGSASWLRIPSRWLRTLGDPHQLAAVQVEGDCMAPTINPGEIAIVDHSPSGRRSPVASGVYLVRIAGVPHVARLRVGLGGGIDVIADNPAYSIRSFAPGDPDLDVLGRVVWAGRRF